MSAVFYMRDEMPFKSG